MRRRFIAALAATAVAIGCGSLNSIVGGDCPEGMVLQGDRCVPAPTATADGGDGTDGGAQFDGSSQDGTLPDGTPTADASDGGTSDDGGTDGGGGGADASDGNDSSCDKKLTLCSSKCVDLQTDPYNCGGCGKQCQTLLCAGGSCQGALNGHVVLIGHDFTGAYSASQQRVLANAAMLPNGGNVRVRSWETYSDSSSVTNVRAIISGAAAAQNRTVVFTQAMLPADVLATSVLTTDVLLLNDQPNAPAATLGGLGTTFAAALSTFTKDGGIVIVTDGGSGATPQMTELVKNAGLLDVTAETNITFGSNLSVAAPADAIGLGVFSPYAAGTRTVHFACNEPSLGFVSWVVVEQGDAGMMPVVIHKVIP